MHEFKKRRSVRESVLRFYIGVIGLLMLLFLTVVAVKAAWGMYGKFSAASQSSMVAQQELTLLQTQEAQVRTAVEELSTPRGVEAQIRQRYGVAKPGEGEIRIVHDASTSSAQASPQGNVFVRIWHALFPW